MAVNRNSKPSREARMSLILGWIVAGKGNVERLIGKCGRCGQDATTYNLQGIAGRPNRYFVLAHADSATATSYAFDQVFGCCNYCNDADKTSAIRIHAIQPFARAFFLTDTRVSAPEAIAALGREKAEMEHGPAQESASTRLPL